MSVDSLNSQRFFGNLKKKIGDVGRKT